ncbi:MAG: caspase family protein [Candidatus Riflebacteria bacterium]|nr:caspase family protein [Candidatus Riflebacteria bacterium]
MRRHRIQDDNEVENPGRVFQTASVQQLTIFVVFMLLFLCDLTVVAAVYADSGTTSAQTEKKVSWQPSQTIALLVGVLNWHDNSLASYTADNRYDQQLYDILLRRGVPESNIIFLKDGAATLAAIQQSLQKLLEKSDEQSLFVFYYTGHGDKSEDGTETYFFNCDGESANPATTSLKLSSLAEIIQKNHKGKRAILTADCCYSGNLNKVAEILGASGIDTLVLSSATAANDSTGEWTFTRSLNEILSGIPLMQFDELELTTKVAADYISYNMACGEMQLANYYLTPGFPENLILTKLKARLGQNQSSLGKYRTFVDEGIDYKVRIIGQNGDKCKIHYVDLESEPDEWRDYSELKEIEWQTYDLDSKIEVKWEGKWYPARVIDKSGIFHYIRYDDYDEIWSEWVASDRIRTSKF